MILCKMIQSVCVVFCVSPEHSGDRKDKAQEVAGCVGAAVTEPVHPCGKSHCKAATSPAIS